MANEVGSIYVSVMPTTSGLTRQMNNDLTGAFTGAATSGTRTFGQMFRRVAVAGAAILATLGLGKLLKDTIALGVSYNTLEQSSKAAFTTMLGTAEAAAEMQKSIREFAMTSPFPRQAFIQGSQQLLAFGVRAEKVIPILGAVQDAVAAAGGSSQQLEEIIFVMAQIQAAGKITGQDLIQFGQRGINAAELIGSQMGKTGAQIKAEITAGTLGAEDALDALTAGMKQKFDGAAQNLKQTWVGSKDRIAGVWRDLSSELVAPFIDPNGGGYAVEWANKFADLLRSIQASPAFDKLKKNLDAFGGRLDKLVQGGLSTLALLFEEDGPAKFRAELDRIAAQFPGLQTVLAIMDALHPLGPAIGKALAELGPQLAELAPSFAELVDKIVPLLPPLTDLVIALVPSLILLLPPVVDLLIQTADAAIRLAPSIEALAVGIGWVASALSMGMGRWNEFFKIIEDGKVTAKELYDFLFRFPGPVGDVARAIGNFGASVANSLIDPINAVAAAIEGFVNAVQAAVGSAQRIRIDRLPRVPNVDALGARFGHGVSRMGSGDLWAPGLAKSGTVLPRPGGTLVRAAEAGRAESIVDTGKLNALMDAASGGGSSRPIYADGVGLIGWLKQVAGREAELVFAMNINRANASQIGRRS